MQIISQFVPLPLADPAQGTAVAMGNFGGLRSGRREGGDGSASVFVSAACLFPVEDRHTQPPFLSMTLDYPAMRKPLV